MFIPVIATAFHNAAVEYEYVNDYPKSLTHYQKAIDLIKSHFEHSNVLVKTFSKNYELAKQKARF